MRSLLKELFVDLGSYLGRKVLTGLLLVASLCVYIPLLALWEAHPGWWALTVGALMQVVFLWKPGPRPAWGAVLGLAGGGLGLIVALFSTYGTYVAIGGGVAALLAMYVD